MKRLFPGGILTPPSFTARAISTTRLYSRPFRLNKRSFTASASRFTMSDLKVELTAPNGRKITLPTGLYINGEFVKATGGQTITSINPT